MGKQKKISKISMEKEVNRKAEVLAQEIASDPTLQDVEVTEAMDQRMEARICAYEAEERKDEHIHVPEAEASEAPEASETSPAYAADIHRARGFHKPKLWVALAAVFILVLSTGITTMSEKSFWKTWWDTMWGDDKVSFVDVEEMDAIESDDSEEANAYFAINDVLDINAVCLDNLSAEIVFQSYIVDQEQGLAKIYYKYKDEVIQYTIYLNGNDASYGKLREDEMTDTFEVESSKQKVRVEEYGVPNKSTHEYIAYFEYGGIHYQLRGVVERQEMEEIIKNLKYL